MVPRASQGPWNSNSKRRREGMGCRQELETDWSHLYLHTGSRRGRWEGEQEVGWDYTHSKPTLSDVLPPATLYLLKSPWLHKEWHLLGMKCLNTWTFGGRFSSKAQVGSRKCQVNTQHYGKEFLGTDTLRQERWAQIVSQQGVNCEHSPGSQCKGRSLEYTALSSWEVSEERTTGMTHGWGSGSRSILQAEAILICLVHL